MGKLSSAELTIAMKLRSRHKQRVNISSVYLDVGITAVTDQILSLYWPTKKVVSFLSRSERVVRIQMT